jgi:hypothetical protein
LLQTIIEPALRQQLGVRTEFGNPTATDDDYTVRVLHRRQSVRYNETRATLLSPFQRFLNHLQTVTTIFI